MRETPSSSLLPLRLAKASFLLILSTTNFINGAFYQPSLHYQRRFALLDRSAINVATPLLSPLLSSSADETNDSENEEEDEFFLEILSPMQTRFLKKEIAKRRATSTIPIFNIQNQDNEESSEFFSDETLDSINKLLDESEIVEVRGISRNAKKRVFQMSEDLAMILSSIRGTTVHRVETKGFTSTLYCAWEDDERDGKIKLRTSVGQKNTWVKKPKALRDNRGQIIPGTKSSDN